MSTVEERQEQIHSLAEKPKAGIMEKSVCIKVELKRPGTIRKVGTQIHVPIPESASHVLFEGATADVITEAVRVINDRVSTDVTLLSVSKHILTCPEVKAIERYDGEIRKFLKTRALPSMFSAGVYLVAIPAVPEIDHVLQNMQANRAALVSSAIAAYSRIVEDDKTKLGDMFDERNYLTAAQFESAFSMNYSYISYAVNEKLKQISQELYKREQAKAAETFAEAGDQIRVALREAMAGLVNHMVDRLSGAGDGKMKKFQKSTIDNFQEFLTTFAQRNITEDDEMTTLVDKAKLLLEGVDPETLRDNATVQDRLRQGFDDVKKHLDTMLENVPARKFRFEGGETDLGEVI